MNSWRITIAALAATSTTMMATADGQQWATAANNGQLMPGSDKLFNSYNQPSINTDGLIVFRARSKGPSQPVRGVYVFDSAVPGGSITTVAAVSQEVPQPNNTSGGSGGGLAPFREFPSFPRIDIASGMIATRGQSSPVWTYLLPDGTETRVGTSGVYATVDGTLQSGVGLLGAVADPVSGALVFPWFQVPSTAPGTRFDQFPGAASACDGEFITFKGNWTETSTGLGRTGVYFRSMTALGGQSPVVRVADSTMIMPGQVAGGTVPFGSTAPPSAAFGHMVFVGLDVEEAPTMGGIFLAPLQSDAPLTALVSLGDQVPGESEGARFTRIGEALSFDGQWVAFWGAWGSRMVPHLLSCPTDGNADLLQYCNEQFPDGYLVEVPEHQGFFAVEVSSGVVYPIATTGSGVDDMLYWNFSGSPPDSGSGDEGGDQELPRWRSATFVAVSGTSPGKFDAVFKANAGGADSLYRRLGSVGPAASPLIGMTTPGTDVDPQAPIGSFVTAVGIERDALRGGRLAITASMLEPVSGEAWAGIYVRDMPSMVGCAADLDGDGSVGGSDLGDMLSQWGCSGPCSADLDGDSIVGGSDLGLLVASWGPCN